MEPRIDAARLIDFLTAVYRSAGVPEGDARLVADSLVQADLWGHQSHGVLRASWYLARLKSGVMAANAAPHLVVDSGAVAVIEGNEGIGQVLTAHAAREAIKRAKVHGIAAVAVRNSNHFGTCMYYTRMGAGAGCVMLLTTNGGPAMAPWGGNKKMVMDMLSGVLSASSFLSAVHGPYETQSPSGAGHFIIAMSIEAFQPLAEFNSRMERFIQELKSVPLAKDIDEVFYPGEIEARNDARNRKQGLALPADTLADLAKIAKGCGVQSLPFA